MKAGNSRGRVFSKRRIKLADFKSPFFIKNLLKGLAFLAVLVVGYELLKEYVDPVIDYLGQWPLLIYLTFTLSELIFGLIPPELFMIWTLKFGLFNAFVPDVAFLAAISYGAGIIGFFLGRYFSRLSWLQWTMERYIYTYQKKLRRYGGFLVVIGALTPLPFSAVCMLMGASKFPFGRFMLISLTRFVRFAAYAWAIWQTNKPV